MRVRGTAGRDGGQELEFILRSLVELKLQVEELRRRLDDQPQRVQVIELGDSATVHDVLPEGDSDGDRPVVYRPGMTMAEVEKRPSRRPPGHRGTGARPRKSWG